MKLRVYGSLFVPMAKWSMLLTGNYRCVTEGDARPIKEAVHSDVDASRAIYAWVDALAQSMGADPADQVPFEKYANAAQSLLKPSSAARAIYAGAPRIERVDKLVQTIASSKGQTLPEVDEIVSIVDGKLAANQAT